MRTPYAFADEQLLELKKFVSAEFHNAANAMSFDEVNILSAKKLTKQLYTKLIARNEKVFNRIGKRCYKNAVKETDEDISNLVFSAAIIVSLLSKYHSVTQYQYNNEAIRKRDRFTEVLLSTQDAQSFRKAFNDAAKRWFEQSRQYADFSVTEARSAAFKDANVQKVRWMAEQDDRTCRECRELDGKIFEIDNVPEIPRHRHCRCWLVPVLDG